MPLVSLLQVARLVGTTRVGVFLVLKRGISSYEGYKPSKLAFNFKHWKENAHAIATNIENRKANADIFKVLKLHESFREINKECDVLRAQRNAISKSKQEANEDQKQVLIDEGRAIKDRLSSLEKKATQLEELLFVEALKIPNDTHKLAPIGPESKAAILQVINNKPSFTFTPQDHVQIGESLGILDLESGSKASGSKFYYMKHQGALLDLALVQWALQRVSAKGFIPVITPDIVHHSFIEACGFQPRGSGSQVYWLRDSDLCLVGTAEVSLAAMFAGKILEPRDLPIKMVGFSHCFRAETGGGSYNRGLYRVHQFSKVEMFVICLPEQSESLHNEIRMIQEDLYRELGLHFRVLDMPSEDLGASAFRKYDIEAWMPSRNTYGEITSASNCTDYQSRRLNIKCRVAAHENHYVHTLNGTACATSRVLLSILENYQQQDGTIIIPEALRPFMGGTDKISFLKNKNN